MTSKKEEKAVLDAIGKKEKRQECSSDLREKTLLRINNIKNEKKINKIYYKYAYVFSSLILVACIVFGILHFTNAPADDVHYAENDLIEKNISINEITNYFNGNVEIRNFDIFTISVYITKADDKPIYLEIKYKSNILMEENTLLPEDIYLIIILNDKYKYYKVNEYQKCLTPLDITDGYYNELLTSETVIEAMAYFDYQNKIFYICKLYAFCSKSA